MTEGPRAGKSDKLRLVCFYHSSPLCVGRKAQRKGVRRERRRVGEGERKTRDHSGPPSFFKIRASTCVSKALSRGLNEMCKAYNQHSPPCGFSEPLTRPSLTKHSQFFITHLPLDDICGYLLLFNCCTCHCFVFSLDYKHAEIKDSGSALFCLPLPILTFVHSPIASSCILCPCEFSAVRSDKRGSNKQTTDSVPDLRGRIIGQARAE